VKRRLGVWLIGTYGNVATCAVAGAAAITRGLLDRTGLVTETPLCAGVPLAPLDSLVFGGWDVRTGSVTASAREFGERNGLLDAALRRGIAADLRRADRAARPGLVVERAPGRSRDADAWLPRGEKLAAAYERLKADLHAFRETNRLDDVVVVNLASTERDPGDSEPLRSVAGFRRAIAKNRRPGLPPSVVYAMAAMDCGFPFVDFTPAVAAGTPAVRAAARAAGLPAMGRDGKTGETLVKTVLAPLFVARHLPVMSWEGFNMLGNRDGEVLRDAGALASKVRDKDEALRRILRDDTTHSRVRIDYVPSLDDWKQAYDFIHFRGFLGARMQMHFLWQGCDSALAAPLVLDLVRITALAHRRGEAGTLPQLACFFKTPLDVDVQEFGEQMRLLTDWCEDVRAGHGA
jgi:myo-inositol-1-phosphate synthase